MPVRTAPRSSRRTQPGAYNAKVKTVQWKNWRSVNQTDARTAIDDDDLYWLENVISIGKGSLKVVPPPAATVATVTAGIATLWGATLGTTPTMLSINSDGSISQITTGGVVTVVAAAGTVTTAAHVTIWRNTDFLILDPTTGYHSWNGTTFTTISAGTTGTSIAVFEGRVWIGSSRTITYTAPNTFSNFTAGDGAGSTTITDEAFPGAIVALTSALEQLWIIGAGAIDAIANVQSTGTSPSVVTTFSVTNIVTNLGSAATASTLGYFRALAFAAPFGFYALSGVTPQKLSGELDGLFPFLTLGDCPAGVAVVESKPCLCFLTTYIGSNAQAQVATPGNISMLLCFTEGKWFFGVQNTSLRWITTLIVNGVSQVWGCTAAGAIFQCFGGTSSDTTIWKIQSKLYDFGDATRTKALLKIGLDYQANGTVAPTLTVDSEYTTGTITLSAGNTLTIVNNSGVVLQLQNNVLANLTIVSQGQVLDRQAASLFGRYLGWTLAGTTTPLQLQLIAMEYMPTRQWELNSVPT